MDTAAIAALATEMSQTRVAAEAQVAVMKKAMNLQSAAALQLLQAAVQAPQPANNPPHLGNKIDVYA